MKVNHVETLEKLLLKINFLFIFLKCNPRLPFSVTYTFTHLSDFRMMICLHTKLTVQLIFVCRTTKCLPLTFM